MKPPVTFIRVRRSRMNTCKKATLSILAIGYVFLWVVALFNHQPTRVIYTLPDPSLIVDMSEKNDNGQGQNSRKHYCKVDLSSLTYQYVDTLEDPDYKDIIKANPLVEKGGQWAPKTCAAFQKVAIIVPYRDRWHHLKLLLKRLHPMLMRQYADYRIFVIEQDGTDVFNRGMLKNIGFKEAVDLGSFNCFIFHDVDLLPEHDRNLYLCDNEARHLASAIDEMRYHVMFYNQAGGVLAINKENVLKTNGYSNNYWGWGQEDDDISARTNEAGLKLSRPPEYIGRFKMVRHSKASQSDTGNSYFLYWKARWKVDGINSLSSSANYKVVSVNEEALYTRILVDIGAPPKYEDVMKSVSEHRPMSLLWYLQFYFP